MSRLMPRGMTRACVKSCGYTAFTLHTGTIPCTTPGCDGHLGWPDHWPHVCTYGHGADLAVQQTSPPGVPPTECTACQELKKTRRTR